MSGTPRCFDSWRERDGRSCSPPMQPAPRPAPPADIWDDSDPAAQVSPPPVGPQVGDHDGSRTRRWWQHPILIIGMLVVCFPLGLTFVWMSTWKRGTKVLASGLVVVLAGILIRVGLAAEADLGADTSRPSPLAAEAEPVAGGQMRDASPSRATTAPAPMTASAPVTAPAVELTEVIDGDTIVVSGGVRVRLIGIDTPERGSPGYSESTDALSALVRGRRVVLVPGARDDIDVHGRLLRYVEADGADVGLAMLRSGQARSRYDSRDGYGAHPREKAYIEADTAAPDLWAAPVAPIPPTTVSAAPVPVPLADIPGADPRFKTCKEATSGGYGPYTSGADPEYDWYRDPDHDGVVCER